MVRWERWNASLKPQASSLKKQRGIALFLVSVVGATLDVSPRASAEPVGQIVNYNSGRCLSINYSSHWEGEWANQWDCAGVPAQLWTVQLVSGNQYRLISNNSGKCLDVMGGPSATANGIHTTQYRCLLGATNQLWTIEQVSGSWYRIRAVHSGRCLSVDYSYTANIVGGVSPPGYGINQWDCVAWNGPFGMHPAQLWSLASPPSGTVAGNCGNSQIVQRLNLQPGDLWGTGMRSDTRKTAYAWPDCAANNPGSVVAQPGAHLGLGFDGNGGLVEVGFYRQFRYGDHRDFIFSELLINGNPPFLDLTVSDPATPCGQIPYNDQTAQFSVAIVSGSTWQTSSTCGGTHRVFTATGFSIGRPAVEFEELATVGLRSGGGLLARQTNIQYRDTGAVWRNPTGTTCHTASTQFGGNLTGNTWTVTEGTGTC
jgi:Ricin-type beta-trefoil lectin domain